jgi:hypothetical protein
MGSIPGIRKDTNPTVLRINLIVRFFGFIVVTNTEQKIELTEAVDIVYYRVD